MVRLRHQQYSSSCIRNQQQTILHRPPMPRVLPGTTTTTASAKSSDAVVVVGKPPMPRVLPETTSSSSQATAATINNNNNTAAKEGNRGGGRGSFLITCGWLMLGLLGIDQYLQYSEKKQVHDMLTKLQKEEAEQRRKLLEEFKDAPTLYTAVVHMKYKMGGTKGLRGIVLNDELEVLQEGVGPEKAYCLCRIKRTTTGKNGETTTTTIAVGWYPTSFMTKIEEKTKRFWLF